MEQTWIQKELPVFSLWSDFVPVHIHHIWYELECIERDSYWESYSRHGLRHAEHCLYVAKEKSQILEYRKTAKHYHKVTHKIKLLRSLGISGTCLIYANGKQPAHQSLSRQEQKISRASPGIEHQWKYQQYLIAFLRAHRKICYQVCSEKNKQKY